MKYAERMKLTALPLFTTAWADVPETEHPGEHGHAIWRTQNLGDVRIRMVEYTPGYLADHWCSKGHVVLCVAGELETELADGRRFTLTPGMSYQVGDGEPGHRSSTKAGATLFIVD